MNGLIIEITLRITGSREITGAVSKGKENWKGTNFMNTGRIKHGSSSIENSIAELYGGIKQQIIFFAAETGIGANWVAERISTLLSPQRQGVYDQLPAVQRETTGTRRTVEPLALAEHAHSSETPPTIAAKRSSSKIKEYWAKMSPQEKAAVMAAKLVKTSKHRDLTPLEKARLVTLRVTAAGVKPPKKNETGSDKKTISTSKAARTSATKKPANKTPVPRDDKQKVYAARHAARKLGLPVPPPPPKERSSPQESAA